MKGRWWVFFSLCLAFFVGYFAYSRIDMQEPEEESLPFETDEFRVMDIPLRQIDYSPMVSAILYMHLNEGKLPLTFSCKILSSQPLKDKVYCRIEQRNERIVRSLEQEECWAENQQFVTQATFRYELSDMLKAGKQEDEVISFLKSLQKSPKNYVKYLGTDSLP